MMEKGRRSDARKLFHKILRSQHNHLDANYLLGTLYAEDGDLVRAEQLLGKAFRIKPDSPYILNNLGNVYREQAKYEDALESYLKATEIKPDMPEAWCNLGVIHMLTGNLEDAKKHFETAEKLQPGMEKAVAGLAALQERAGDYRKARKSMKKAIRSGARDVHTVMAFAETVLHDDPSPAELQSVRGLVNGLVSAHDSPAIPGVEQPKAYYLLGAINDKLNNHEQAFACYQTANQRSFSSYDIKKLRESMAGIKENFPREVLHSSTRDTGDDLIFIVGMPRSGSTLVEQILDSHPQVASLGECEYFAKAMSKVGTKSLDSPLTEEQIPKVANEYRKYARQQHPKASILTDKTLPNFLHIGQIRQVFPAAKIIHCKRDPLDTCLSCYFHNFVGKFGFTNDLVTLGRYFRAYQGLMHHWHETLQDSLYELAYENLTGSPKTEIRQLLDFCGLKFKRSCLKSHQNKRVVKTASYYQVRKPIYRSAVNRSLPYRQYFAPLLRELEDGAST